MFLKCQKRPSELTFGALREIPHKTAISQSKKMLFCEEKVSISTCDIISWGVVGQTIKKLYFSVFPHKNGLFQSPRVGGRKTVFWVKMNY